MKRSRSRRKGKPRAASLKILSGRLQSPAMLQFLLLHGFVSERNAFVNYPLAFLFQRHVCAMWAKPSLWCVAAFVCFTSCFRWISCEDRHCPPKSEKNSRHPCNSTLTQSLCLIVLGIVLDRFLFPCPVFFLLWLHWNCHLFHF